MLFILQITFMDPKKRTAALHRNAAPCLHFLPPHILQEPRLQKVHDHELLKEIAKNWRLSARFLRRKNRLGGGWSIPIHGNEMVRWNSSVPWLVAGAKPLMRGA
jgi:hypothetical protein